MRLVNNAREFSARSKAEDVKELQRLTGINNPNSAAQLKGWLSAETGKKIDSIDKQAVSELLNRSQSLKIKRVLKLRQGLSKSSVAKYDAMARSVCSDGRIHGSLQFYGANRTGRWAGRLVQAHNLPKNKMKDLDAAREDVIQGDYERAYMLYEMPHMLSELIRTAIIPSEGCKFIVSDFSAIEARVLAWLADESWRVNVFNTTGRIYEASAAQMFRVPIESVTKGSTMRQKGKIAELALGYGGGKGSLISMGAYDMGLKDEELQPLVTKWRAGNKRITAFWKEIQKAAQEAVNGKPQRLRHGLKLFRRDNILFIRLPSERCLAYQRPSVDSSGEVCYWGSGSCGIVQERTYGGKLTENIVQAIARDCLAAAMQRVTAAGYDIVFHVHDEIIAEVPQDSDCLHKIMDIMGEPIEWAAGLPLKADGFECLYYKKD